MKRRAFITLLGGAAAAWPLAARAQQGERMRRIGVLMNTAESNAEGQAQLAAFRQRLQELGWTEGRNVRIDVRWGAGDVVRIRGHAAELVGLSPDVLLAYASAQLTALARETRAIPIVFIGASDPVGAGFVASFARPGGNITGFTTYEPSLGGKWLATLKEIAPATVRAALMVNPDITFLQGRTYVPAFESAAAALSVEPVTAHVRSTGDIEAALDSLGQRPGGGLIVVPESFTSTHRELIVRLAAQHRVPAMYPYRQFPESGGLMSYGPDNVDTFRRSAAYIDRILRGEKPAELPVQAPTKFELVINLKTAKALGLQVPESFLVRADEVIE
jgi:putative tryptophan/tyrosine transport system substrate-binding protein